MLIDSFLTWIHVYLQAKLDLLLPIKTKMRTFCHHSACFWPFPVFRMTWKPSLKTSWSWGTSERSRSNYDCKSCQRLCFSLPPCVHKLFKSDTLSLVVSYLPLMVGFVSTGGSLDGSSCSQEQSTFLSYRWEFPVFPVCSCERTINSWPSLVGDTWDGIPFSI